MKLTALIILTLPLAAQNLTVTAPPTAKPGSSIQLRIDHNVPGAAAAQWVVLPPAANWITGQPTGQPAGKIAQCREAVPRRCLVGALNKANNAAMPAGAIASIPLVIPHGTAPGNYSLSIGELYVSDANGGDLPSTPIAATIRVLSKYDVTGPAGVPDGIVDERDTAWIANATLEASLCGDCVGPQWRVHDLVIAAVQVALNQ